MKNIFSNIIPHETVVYEDKDPPEITKKINNFIHEKNTVYNNYQKSNESIQLSQVVQNLQNLFSFKSSI